MSQSRLEQDLGPCHIDGEFIVHSGEVVRGVMEISEFTGQVKLLLVYWSSETCAFVIRVLDQRQVDSHGDILCMRTSQQPNVQAVIMPAKPQFATWVVSAKMCMPWSGSKTFFPNFSFFKSYNDKAEVTWTGCGSAGRLQSPNCT